MESNQVTWPKLLLVDVRDLLKQLRHETDGTGLRETDYQEILFQVIDLLLNFGRNASESYHLLPDVSRLYDLDMDRNQENWLLIQSASFRFAVALQQRVTDLGAWRTLDNGRNDFPYVFNKWHGGDLVLEYLPF